MSKILIVDDSETMRRHVRTTLADAGYTTCEASDGIEGLRVLQQQRDVSAVILDVNMPRMSGLDMLEKMLVLQLSRPALVVTSEADPELISRARAAGAKGWLVKPVKPAVLASAVRKILG